MSKIFQYHASVVEADAIGNSIRILNRKLLERGLESYVCCADSELLKSAAGVLPASAVLEAKMGRSLSDSDVLVLHYSFYDDVIAQLAGLPLKRVLVYHNVTPGSYFAEVGMDDLAHACDASRRQLGALPSLFDAAVGVSSYNASELVSNGFKDVDVIPILLDLEPSLNNEIDVEYLQHLKSGADVNILFVGRFVPNKRIERILSAISHFKRSFSLSINFHMVGKIWNQTYFSELVNYASCVDILDCVRFHFQVDDLRLRTLYAATDAFVCMSDHEGFMAPVVEAFAAGCPVVALDAAAVGETMGGAGLLLSAPDPELVAGLAYALKTDDGLRRRIVAGQGRRLPAFHPDRATRLWLDKIRAVSPTFDFARPGAADRTGMVAP